MSENHQKTLGQVIDQLVEALKDLDISSRSIAIKAVCEHLNIPIINPSSQTSFGKSTELINNIEEDSLDEPQNLITDIRTLKENKNPSNSQEMACIVALYLDQFAPVNERKKEIGTQDIEKYFKQAGFPLPKAIGQVLRDAKGAGYFDSSSRGKFKLNPVGYNLAAHSLPRVKK